MHQWHVFEQKDMAAAAAADFLADSILGVLQKKTDCHVILPGGNTPVPCFQQLLQKDLPWEQIHWYPGDERCCPIGDPERNDVMLQRYFWSYLPAGHFYHIPAELGAEEAAEKYGAIIGKIGRLDIAFLGLGEDGHTASLFPDNPALDNSALVVPVYHAPKPPAQRVSLGLSTLQQADCKLVLAMGEGKSKAIQQIREGRSLPINRIGDIDWFIDKAADMKAI